MNKKNNESLYLFDDEIDLTIILNYILEKKNWVILITLIFSFLSVVYSLSISNIYISTTVLAPTKQEESLSNKLGRFSPVASFSGITLPGGDPTTDEAIERIMSYDFFKDRFIPNINFEDLVAQRSWDIEKNKIEYDAEIFDIQSMESVSKCGFPGKKKPSCQDAFKNYKDTLNISISNKTGFVSISVEHISPYVAKSWLEIIIKEINHFMRELDQVSANNSIEFLNLKAQENNVSELNYAISELLKNEMQTLMLAESSKDHVFKSLALPMVPEKKSKPNRAMICIAGTILGFIFGIFLILFNFFSKSRTQNKSF